MGSQRRLGSSDLEDVDDQGDDQQDPRHGPDESVIHRITLHQARHWRGAPR